MNWLPIPEWGRYEVSDEGFVRSRDMTVNAKGGASAVRKGRELSLIQKTNGYWAVTLTSGTKRSQESVHRLVALVFHGAPPHKGAHVLHSDGDKNNNSANNLRWGTPADNHADTERHGHRLKGERHPQAKLTEEAVRNIRNSDVDASVIAAQYDVTREHIWSVRRGRAWQHVS
jgi:hypothetical protein